MVPSSERSDHLSAQTSPRLMPVVRASSMAMPKGAGCARLASSSMRVRSSRGRALMGALARLGGLQKSQGFLVMGPCAMPHLSASQRPALRLHLSDLLVYLEPTSPPNESSTAVRGRHRGRRSGRQAEDGGTGAAGFGGAGDWRSHRPGAARLRLRRKQKGEGVSGTPPGSPMARRPRVRAPAPAAKTPKWPAEAQVVF